MSSSNKEGGSGKKRESHPGSRNVSSMSAEKLERKRAHDREAQRSIRQRTKETIEQLENEVASLRSHNIALEEEVRGLKGQLASLTERRSVPVIGQQFSAFPDDCPIQEGPGRRGNTVSSVPSTNSIHSQFHDLPHVPGLPLVPGTNQGYSIHANDWTPYASTRSRSLGCSDQEPSARMESYLIDGQLHEGPRVAQPSLSVVVPQISFGGPNSAPNPHQPEPLYSHVPYPRSMSMSIPSSVQAASVQHNQPYQSSPPFHNSLTQTSHGNQTYTYQSWDSKS